MEISDAHGIHIEPNDATPNTPADDVQPSTSVACTPVSTLQDDVLKQKGGSDSGLSQQVVFTEAFPALSASESYGFRHRQTALSSERPKCKCRESLSEEFPSPEKVSKAGPQKHKVKTSRQRHRGKTMVY